MNKMKVTVISGSFPRMRCGVGDYTKKMTDIMLRKDVRMEVLTSSDGSIREAGYVHPVIKKWNIFSLFKIAAFIRRSSPDIVHLQAPTLSYRATLSAVSILPAVLKMFCNRVPVMLTIHDYAISGTLNKFLFLPLFLFSDIIAVTNEEDRNDIAGRFPFLRGRIRKVRMGPFLEVSEPDEAEKAGLRAKIFYRSGDRFISTLGFLKRDRHFDVIVKAFHRLSVRDEHLKLLILGDTQRERDNPYVRYVLSLIKSFGIEDKVHWAGLCGPIEASFYIPLSEVGILLFDRGASFRRSSIINYMVRNVPVVTNIVPDHSGDTELTGSGACSIINSLSEDEVCARTEAVLYDGSLARSLKGKMAAQADKFNWDTIAGDILRIYSGMLKR
ncbi:MAG: glycosyltransferase family 4 protein [Candidatus Omnitrophota bacterium]